MRLAVAIAMALQTPVPAGTIDAPFRLAVLVPPNRGSRRAAYAALPQVR